MNYLALFNLVAIAVCTVNAFGVSRVQKRCSSPFRTSALSAHQATLTDETTWRLRFSMNGIPTTIGKKVDELFVIEAQFLEDEGYEPPQGDLRQLLLKEKDKDNATRLRIVKGRWKLSEDPNDRKDGLWVWGLFEEPLYPFLLLQLETDRISLPGDDNDSVKPLKLFAQISHTRDKESGVTLEGAKLNIREMETVKADPFGGATVDVYEEVSVGQLRIEPVSTSAVV